MTRRRLIEEELPLKVINAESSREKHARKGHISAMHLWWARRPLAMSRAVVFGTLLPDPGDATARRALMRDVALASGFEASSRQERLDPLRRALRDAYGHPPKVLDCFAGGGAIPLEALRLGCDVIALELNPVAHLIELSTLVYPQRFAPDGANPSGHRSLAEDFVYWAGWVRKRVEDATRPLYPSVLKQPPSVYYWCRTMICSNPGCGAEIPLVSSRWIANSNRRKAWIKFEPSGPQIATRLMTSGPLPTDVGGTVRASSVTCPSCGTSQSAREVRQYGHQRGFGNRLLAVSEIADGHRSYREPTVDEVVSATTAAERSLQDLADLPDGTSAVPDEECDPNGFRRLQGLVFGFKTWRSLFNSRQLYLLGRLTEAVRDAHIEMLAQGMPEDRALATATYLAFAVDRIADYNSTFAAAHVTMEAIRNTFPQQAIRMTWDYTEINPFAGGPGSWEGAVAWIESAIRHCAAASGQPATVLRGNAQELPFESRSFDAVIIDPPYYDAIQYSYLSDFFYVWLKRSVGHLYPEAFATPATPKTVEVVQNQAKRDSSAYVSDTEFDRRLLAALSEIRRVVRDDGMVALVFAHTDVTAWERLLRALIASDLIVSTSWPMRSESEVRSTASLQHAVLGSSVVLVCRPRDAKEPAFYDDVVRALEDRIAQRLDAFEEIGLVGADYFVSAIGPAFEVFAQYARVVKLSGDDVDVGELMVLARQSVARHAMRRLLGSESLTAVDHESLFYLTWRWAYATADIPADEAYKLERAFDVDLGQLCRPGGFAMQTGSNFGLLGPHERRGIKVGSSPALIDVLHAACQLWDTGRRRELEEVLGATGAGAEPGFWALARALGEILPDGNKERLMLLGLTGNREALAEAAARSQTTIEELNLFEVQPQ